MRRTHQESHRSERGGWLRAAILGADDGIVSTASLMMGVGAASESKGAMIVAGIAGLVAGALSMAAGEYVSVSSQRDAENADIDREKKELAADPKAELRELASIYRRRGLDADLAEKVAEQLSAGDRLGAHVRDELGIEERTRSRPIQAAIVSAASFASLGVVPIAAALLTPTPWRLLSVTIASLATLAVLGALGGWLGGASTVRAAMRVFVGGGLAMGVTAAIGHFLGGIGI